MHNMFRVAIFQFPSPSLHNILSFILVSKSLEFFSNSLVITIGFLFLFLFCSVLILFYNFYPFLCNILLFSNPFDSHLMITLYFFSLELFHFPFPTPLFLEIAGRLRGEQAEVESSRGGVSALYLFNTTQTCEKFKEKGLYLKCFRPLYRQRHITLTATI